MRKWLRGLALAASALSLSGCITFGAIDTRGTALNEGIGAWQNQGVLLNLVRASRDEPLYFLSLNNATGQGTMDFKFGYPLFTLGPHLTLPQKQYSLGGGGTNALDNSTFTSFQVNAYSNTQFYQGIMQPLTLNEVNALLNQGFPRELIFYLVIDKARLTDKSGNSFFIYNDPTKQPQYATLFKTAIREAMISGLMTEVPNPDATATGQSPGTPPAPGGRTGSGTSGTTTSTADRILQALANINTSPSKGPATQLCFERSLANDEGKALFDKQEANGTHPGYCGHGPRDPHKQLTVLLPLGEYKIEIYTRSVSAIFHYLGWAVAHQDLMPTLEDYHVTNEATPTGKLLEVTNDMGGLTGIGCFAHVYYADQPWCVPEHGSQLTRDVFNVLTMLVALKQQPGDLPQSSTVLLGG